MCVIIGNIQLTLFLRMSMTSTCFQGHRKSGFLKSLLRVSLRFVVEFDITDCLLCLVISVIQWFTEQR